MAPPSVLRAILKDFDYVNQHVLSEAGRRIRLVWPKGMYVLIGCRFRTSTARMSGNPIPGTPRSSITEEERISAYLCCKEPLRYVGLICESQTDDAELRASDRVFYPEVYLASSGRVYVYLPGPNLDCLRLLTDNVEDLISRGLRDCTQLVPCVQATISDVAAVALGGCRNLSYGATWRDHYLGRVVTLADGTTVRVCEAYYAGADVWEIVDWSLFAGVSRLEVLATVMDLPRYMNAWHGARLIMLMDDSARVYIAKERQAEIVLVADTALEFVCFGLARYVRGGVFYADPARKRVSRPPSCPNGVRHDSSRGGLESSGPGSVCSDASSNVPERVDEGSSEAASRVRRRRVGENSASFRYSLTVLRPSDRCDVETDESDDDVFLTGSSSRDEDSSFSTASNRTSESSVGTDYQTEETGSSSSLTELFRHL